MKKQEKLPELTLLDHLTELRLRIIHCIIFFLITFIVCYSFKNEIYNLITYPLTKVLNENHLQSKIIFTKLTENFTSTLSIVLSASMFISIPYWAIELWLFITPALYKEEKRYFLPYIFITPILFLCGVIFCYFLVLPPAFDFFITFGNNGRTTPLLLDAKITDYIELTTSLLNAFGICFLTPIFLILLVKFGILSQEKLKKYRKYAIVFIFIISAILTPPDVFSQILLAIPLIGMYELSILLSKKKK